MSTDIHLHIEIYVDARWEHYSQVRPSGHYAVFEKMAGVRGENCNAIVLPRGLPADMTKLTALDAKVWKADGHSHSWLAANEIVEIGAWWEDKLDYSSLEGWLGCFLYGSEFACVTREDRESVPDFVEDLRFVFWFDC